MLLDVKITYLDHKKDPEAAEDDEDAEDEGEGGHGDQVEEGGQVQVQVASQQNVGDQGSTLNRFWSLNCSSIPTLGCGWHFRIWTQRVTFGT